MAYPLDSASKFYTFLKFLPSHGRFNPTLPSPMTSQRYPISPTVACGGLVYFPRMLDKIRLMLAGALPEVYEANLGKAMDNCTCQFLHVDYTDVRAQVAAGHDDDQVLAWCMESGRRPNAFEIQMFNEFMAKQGFRDDLSDRLRWRKDEAGISGRDDIQTFFDYLDFDEGRC